MDEVNIYKSLLELQNKCWVQEHKLPILDCYVFFIVCTDKGQSFDNSPKPDKAMESGVRLQINELATRTLGLQTSLTIIGGIYEKYGHRTPALLYAPGQGLRVTGAVNNKGNSS